MTLAPSIPAPAAASAREVAVLRLIGRLGVVEVPCFLRPPLQGILMRESQPTYLSPAVGGAVRSVGLSAGHSDTR